MNTVDIVNSFIRARGYSSCLEILGRGNSRLDGLHCARYIRVETAHAWDHGRRRPGFLVSGAGRFDIVVVDGLHQCGHAMADIADALRALNPGGVVVVRNCLPITARMGDPDPQRGSWCGDVYRAAAWHFAQSPYLCYTVDVDFGCGVIDTACDAAQGQALQYDRPDMLTYEEFDKNRDRLLHIVSGDEFCGMAMRGVIDRSIDGSGQADGTLSTLLVYANSGPSADALVAKAGRIPKPLDADWRGYARSLVDTAAADSSLPAVGIGVDTVPLVTVDQLVDCAVVADPELVVIDAKAYGVPVLYGASRTLRRFRPTLLFSIISAGRGGRYDHDIVEHFMRFTDLALDLGYRVVDKLPRDFLLLRHEEAADA